MAQMYTNEWHESLIQLILLLSTSKPTNIIGRRRTVNRSSWAGSFAHLYSNISFLYFSLFDSRHNKQLRRHTYGVGTAS